ncbi:TPA: hypothetical protein ACIBVV_002583 [Salmonella enterica subsp. enterica serovar Potsdam]|nr:hypothetical protein [Salmonella enterica subsp. enterica serovar Bovismorbificans]
MLRELSGVSYTLWRAAFFSLVKAPAMALFIGFVFLSFNNSISDTFLTSARELTGNAPPDKVQTCVFKKSKQELSSYVQKEPCVNTLTDAKDWSQSFDRSIRRIYWTIALLGFFTWFFFDGMAAQLMLKIGGMWERRE